MQFRSAFPLALLLGVLLGIVAGGVGSSRATEPAAMAAVPVEPTEMEPLPEKAVVSWDIPVVWNEPVARFVDLLETKQPDRMALYLKRSGRYEGMIRSKLRERGMPEDLVYLSMIESGFNPEARSRAQAVGLWQFVASTARMYGLRVDGYVDERRDPEKSTDAALRYLQDLHRQFGAWNLAAAAYNTGGGRVSRIMREVTGSVRGEESDFWLIRPRLPRETRGYIPLIFAAALIGKQPDKYGLGAVERWLPVETDTVLVPGGTRLAEVARQIGVGPEVLRQLNPHLIRRMAPPGPRYPVRVPEGHLARLDSAAARVAAAGMAAPTQGAHRVRRGEALAHIARRHGVSSAALRAANGLGPVAVPRVGQVLRIPS